MNALEMIRATVEPVGFQVSDLPDTLEISGYRFRLEHRNPERLDYATSRSLDPNMSLAVIHANDMLRVSVTLRSGTRLWSRESTASASQVSVLRAARTLIANAMAWRTR